jgi:hypothetical protein
VPFVKVNQGFPNFSEPGSRSSILIDFWQQGCSLLKRRGSVLKMYDIGIQLPRDLQRPVIFSDKISLK